MAKRKALSKKVRFEVFKRDSFQCQYCGESAPDVVLHVDHIKPVSKGGDNDVMNLVTSCRSCNSGKSNRELGDDAVIKKQKAQLDALNTRREQLDMMVKWKESLRGLLNKELEIAVSEFEDVTGGTWTLDRSGQDSIRNAIRTFGLKHTLSGIRKSAETYLRFEDNGKCTIESADDAINKIGAFARLETIPANMRDLYYIRGIVRKRISCDGKECLELLKEASEIGVTLEELKEHAVDADDWGVFKHCVEGLIAEKEYFG